MFDLNEFKSNFLGDINSSFAEVLRFQGTDFNTIQKELAIRQKKGKKMPSTGENKNFNLITSLAHAPAHAPKKETEGEDYKRDLAMKVIRRFLGNNNPIKYKGFKKNKNFEC